MTNKPIHLILRASPIEGIGVFTLSPIAKGDKVPVYTVDDSKIITKEEFATLPTEYGKYHVPDKDGHWWGPQDYSRLGIGWYLNHSPTANLDPLAGFVALRDIAAGEELTIDYAYCEFDWVRDEEKRHGRPLEDTY